MITLMRVPTQRQPVDARICSVKIVSAAALGSNLLHVHSAHKNVHLSIELERSLIMYLLLLIVNSFVRTSLFGATMKLILPLTVH